MASRMQDAPDMYRHNASITSMCVLMLIRARLYPIMLRVDLLADRYCHGDCAIKPARSELLEEPRLNRCSSAICFGILPRTCVRGHYMTL